MSQKEINQYSISELLAFKSILASRMGQMDFNREHSVPIDTDLYDGLQTKLKKINSRINQLVELL